MKTKVLLIEQQALSNSQKEEMWNVYKNFYHYSRQYFMQRIEKNTHFSLYLNNGKIGGFTGLRINKFNFSKKENFLIYFGQTVITHELRGKSLIPITGFKLILKYWRQLLMTEAWFWYDALSYKAYLVSAKTLTEYYPSCHFDTPIKTKILMDSVGQYYYADNYCPRTGTVVKPINYIKDVSVKIFDRDIKDEDVAFFAKSNPGHAFGHGLLTFAPINWKNIKLLSERFVKKQLHSFSKYKPKLKSIKNTRLAIKSIIF